jgi:hypothetical protein
MLTRNLFMQIVEKVGWTFVQAFLVALLGTTELDWTTGQAAIAAGVTAVFTLAFASITSAVIPIGLPFYTDLMLRISRSAAAAFFAYLLVEPGAVLEGQAWQGAVGAAGMAVLVVVKGAAAHFVGNPDSAALLPRAVDVIETTGVEVVGYSPNDGDPDAPSEPGELPEWAEPGFVDDPDQPRG